MRASHIDLDTPRRALYRPGMHDYEATAWIHLTQRNLSESVLDAALRAFIRRGDSVQKGAFLCGLLLGCRGFNVLERV